MPLQIPETRYAKSGDVNIAYQVLGEGPIDLILVAGLHLERRARVGGAGPRGVVSGAGRVLPADRLRQAGNRPLRPRHRHRGPGDADGRRARGDGGGRLRASRADRLFGGKLARSAVRDHAPRADVPASSSTARSSPGTGWPPDASRHGMSRSRRRSRRSSGVGARLTTATSCSRTTLRRSSATSAFRRWYSMRLRLSASPADAAALQRMNADVDTRAILPSIRVPTLIVHRVGDQNVDVKNARYARRAHPGRSVPGASRCRPPAVDRRPRGDHRRLPRVPRGGRGARALRRGGAGAHPDHGPLHGHRRLDGAGRRARRQRVAAPARAAPRGYPGRARPVSGAARSTRPETVSSRRSTAPRGRSGVRGRSRTRWRRSESRSAPVSIPASASCSTGR